MHEKEGKAFLSWVMFLQNRSCAVWVHLLENFDIYGVGRNKREA